MSNVTSQKSTTKVFEAWPVLACSFEAVSELVYAHNNKRRHFVKAHLFLIAFDFPIAKTDILYLNIKNYSNKLNKGQTVS